MLTLGTNPNVTEDQGPKIKALRKALGLGQKDVAARSGEPTWNHVYVLRAEKRPGEQGWNQLSTAASRAGMARGLGLSVPDFDAYLAGKLSLADAVARSVARADESPTPAPTQGPAEDDLPDPDPKAVEMEDELARSIDWARYSTVDLDNARRAIRRYLTLLRESMDPLDTMRGWLGAAYLQRTEGKSVAPEFIVARASVGKTARARDVLGERERGANGPTPQRGSQPPPPGPGSGRWWRSCGAPGACTEPCSATKRGRSPWASARGS